MKFLTSFTLHLLSAIIGGVFIYHQIDQHDYQLDAIPNGYILYSGSEAIGFIPAGNSTLDSLIQNHNQ